MEQKSHFPVATILQFSQVRFPFSRPFLEAFQIIICTDLIDIRLVSISMNLVESITFWIQGWAWILPLSNRTRHETRKSNPTRTETKTDPRFWLKSTFILLYCYLIIYLHNSIILYIFLNYFILNVM